MIDSFGIARTENEIAVFAGMVTSSFAFAEFTTGMWWGRLSDKIGRKPVLMIGLVGTLVSMVIFGFAQSFPVALLARAAGGLLNGNIGVIQTTVAEMVPRKEHQPRAFAVMPFVWSVGSIIGPAVGGILADPIKQYPEIFKPGGFLEEYPYALPNLFCSVVLVVGICIGILFFKETHAELKLRRDYGLELGEKLVGLFCLPFSRSKDIAADKRKLLATDSPTRETYSTFSDPPTVTTGDEPLFTPPSKPLPTEKTFTPQIIHLIISYGILAFHTIVFQGLFPVFLSTPKPKDPPSSFFKFVGGFGLSTHEVGIILTVQGILAMLLQFIIFPPLVAKFGAFTIYRAAMILYPISYFIIPYLDFVPTIYVPAAIYSILIIHIIFASITYPGNAILLSDSAPSLLMLGTINGSAAAIASLARSFGPTLSGMIFSYGLDIGYVGLAWWVNAGICIIGAVQAFWLLDPSEEIYTARSIAYVNEEVEEQTAVDGTMTAAVVDV